MQAEPAPIDPLAALAQFVVNEEHIANMVATEMLTPQIARGHLIGICAQSGHGKTAFTMLEAVPTLAAQGFRVLYFQEDAPAADLPRMHTHSKQHGYILLNSTLGGSNVEQELKILRGFVEKQVPLHDYVIVLDTVKKFCDLMHKSGARAFFKLMRSLTLLGATVIFLGHTNKHRGIDGKHIFEGVGDVRNDVDELFYIEATEKDVNGIVLMTIKRDKHRCDVEACATFELDTAAMRIRRRTDVRDVAVLNAFHQQMHEDAELIEHVRALLLRGGMNHTELVDKVRARCETSGTSISRKKVESVIARYSGEEVSDPQALWLETRLAANNARYVSLKPRGERSDRSIDP